MSAGALLVTLLFFWMTPAGAAAPEAVLERARPKVVLVQVCTGSTDRAGTGFIVGPGLILTSEHVVRGGHRATLWINEAPYAAAVLRADPERDLALLTTRDVSLSIKALPLASAATTAPGEPLLILGCHPVLQGGRAPRVRQSLIPARFRGLVRPGGALAGPDGAIELEANIEHGNSGGPVIRLRDGAVIGVVRARNAPLADGRSRTAWAIPIETARSLLPAPEAVTRPLPNAAGEFYLAREARRRVP